MQAAREAISSVLNRGLSGLNPQSTASSSFTTAQPLEPRPPAAAQTPSASSLASGLLQTFTTALSQSFQAKDPATDWQGDNMPTVTAATSPSAPSSSSAEALGAQVQRFRQELAGSCINIHRLAKLAFNGIPEKENLRGLVWKLLLGYLPPSPEEWPRALAKRRTQYHVFCDELMLDRKRLGQEVAPGNGPLRSRSSSVSGGGDADGEAGTSDRGKEGEEAHDPLSASTRSLRGRDVTAQDHPLSLAQTSQWNMFFQDSEVMSQVERDVLRTHPTMHFFTGDSPESEQHREEMKRALFLYAKLNPGLRYIQGMNELIAPLYYLFKHDPDVQARQYAEADAFWCFLELISEFRDHFCAQLDNAQTGIRATIKRLMAVVRHHDEVLWRHIEITHKVDPQYYAFRWITLLLSQEFSLPDTFRIWDAILADPHGRMDCLLRICTAMILHVRPQLMQGDFTVIIKTLQRYPPVDISVLLARAANMVPCKEVPGYF